MISSIFIYRRIQRVIAALCSVASRVARETVPQHSPRTTVVQAQAPLAQTAHRSLADRCHWVVHLRITRADEVMGCGAHGLSIEALGPRPSSRRCAALRWSSGRGGGSPSPGSGLTSRAHGLPSQSPRTHHRSRRRLRSHHRTAGRTRSPPRQWATYGGGSSSARRCIGAGGRRGPPVTVQGVLEWSWWRGGSGWVGGWVGG